MPEPIEASGAHTLYLMFALRINADKLKKWANVFCTPLVSVHQIIPFNTATACSPPCIYTDKHLLPSIELGTSRVRTVTSTPRTMPFAGKLSTISREIPAAEILFIRHYQCIRACEDSPASLSHPLPLLNRTARQLKLRI